jgi:hypothetical protein
MLSTNLENQNGLQERLKKDRFLSVAHKRGRIYGKVRASLQSDVLSPRGRILAEAKKTIVVEVVVPIAVRMIKQGDQLCL